MPEKNSPDSSAAASDPDGDGNAAPEIMFYHLERSHLLEILPILLTRSLERGWRVVAQMASRQQVEALERDLWTFADESFLPHGMAGDGFEAEQPVFITDGEDNPNQASIRFYLGGAEPGPLAGYQRIIYMFDGANMEAVERARTLWKQLKAQGHNLTYWRQNPAGKWEKKG